MLTGRRIHLCVGGGIAAYKAVELARALQRAGAQVQVAMTPNAQAFVGPLTFQAITHAPVLTRTLDASEEMAIGHIEFAQECDALVVAPATANLIGKAANGIGDEVVSTVLLAANVPVIVAPAMNSFMYAHPAVAANLERLRGFGWHVVEPDSGELACGHVGPGRLPDPEAIVAAVAAALTPAPTPLAGRTVVIAAGPTREHLDPVRFLSNPSSGRTGFSLAAAAQRAGARVVLVHGPVALAPPAGVEAVPITSAREMDAAVRAHAAQADAVVMTAAVADWRPAVESTVKEHKAGDVKVVEFVRNPDILAGLGAARTGSRPVLVGFAAETGDPIASARGKLTRKGVDLIVANDVSAPDCGFEVDTNRVWLVSATGEESLPLQAKTAIADRLVAWIAARLEATP
ncbi:MAG: bifunctional phosphopantothenoylcysteine decarboxylase/phosphopantothenate--cysteine ligase CoaBC [Myxococcales bacterium]|nr:bifunctional phosphopantothenoylcysteine decarboxylase/phosphopantothenate--cysteine ligase CoaBC [Myxococcales bacterium]